MNSMPLAETLSSFCSVFLSSENAILPTSGPSPTTILCFFFTALEPWHASLDTSSVTFITSPAASMPPAPVLYAFLSPVSVLASFVHA